MGATQSSSWAALIRAIEIKLLSNFDASHLLLNYREKENWSFTINFKRKRLFNVDGVSFWPREIRCVFTRLCRLIHFYGLLFNRLLQIMTNVWSQRLSRLRWNDVSHASVAEFEDHLKHFRMSLLIVSCLWVQRISSQNLDDKIFAREFARQSINIWIFSIPPLTAKHL